MNEITIDLTKDGSKVIVVGGYSKAWESFKKYPQIEFWSGDQKDIKRIVDNKSIPFGTKAIVISRFISHSELSKVMDEARNRNIPMLANKSDGEISSILDEATRNIKLEIPKFERGKLTPLITLIDHSLSTADAADKLLQICKERNIRTTIQSLKQFVLKTKRDQGRTSVPRSIKSKLDLTVDMLDSMINDMTSMRDYLIEVTEENRSLRKKVDNFKKALEE